VIWAGINDMFWPPDLQEIRHTGQHFASPSRDEQYAGSKKGSLDANLISQLSNH
jgi:hypothetical protein